MSIIVFHNVLTFVSHFLIMPTMKRHIPIMVSEILTYIPEHAKLIVDGTFGHGGHTLAIIQNSKFKIQNWELALIGMEWDPRVIEHGKEYLQTELWIHDLKEIQWLTLNNDSYTNITSYLQHSQKADFVLLDLGINREHVTDNIRWFSIQGEWPLDMRFTPEVGRTAYELIKASSLDVMMTWFMTYADFSEKRAHTIAMVLSNNKSNPKLNSTLWLIELLKEIKIHKNELAPLFQAIRIAVNHEFENITTFIDSLDSILASWWRCAIMTFHSIEDRIIKHHFKRLSEINYTILTKHVITPHYTEVQHNKASRSAKLRVIERK